MIIADRKMEELLQGLLHYLAAENHFTRYNFGAGRMVSAKKMRQEQTVIRG